MNVLIVFLLLVSSPVAVLLFLAKWIDTDFDTAFKTFEDFIGDILK